MTTRRCSRVLAGLAIVGVLGACGASVRPGAVRPSASAVIDASAMPGTTAGQKIAAAVKSLSDAGGVVDARLLSGALTLDVDMFESISKASTLKPGQLLLSPGAHFNVAVTQNLPSSWTVEGGYGGIGTGGASRLGSTFTWTGGDGQPVFRALDAHHVILQGVDVDCANHVGSIGILYDSDNTPASGQSRFEDWSALNCQDGFHWGTEIPNPPPPASGQAPPFHTNAAQADTSIVRNFHVRSFLSNSRGIYIGGGNKANGSVVESDVIQGVNIGVFVEELGPLLRFSDIVFGALGAGLAGCRTEIGNTAFQIGRPGDQWPGANDLSITNSQSEVRATPRVRTSSTSWAESTSAEQFFSKRTPFDEPVTVDAVVSILSMANRGGAPATVTRPDAQVVSIADQLYTANFTMAQNWTGAGKIVIQSARTVP